MLMCFKGKDQSSGAYERRCKQQKQHERQRKKWQYQQYPPPLVSGRTPLGHLTGVLPGTQQKGPCEPSLACNRADRIHEPFARHREVTLRHLESVQNRSRKLHVHVLPYVKMPESLPGVGTNRPDRSCWFRGVLLNTPRESDSTRGRVMRAACCAEMPAWPSEVTDHLFSIEYHPVVFTPRRHSPLLQTHASQRGGVRVHIC